MGTTGLTAAPAPLGSAPRARAPQGCSGLLASLAHCRTPGDTKDLSSVTRLVQLQTEAQTKCCEQLLSVVPLANLI